MSALLLRPLASSLVALLLAACELPTPPFGRPCDEAAPCPDGYTCTDDTCIPDELAADGGVPDAGAVDGGE